MKSFNLEGMGIPCFQKDLENTAFRVSQFPQLRHSRVLITGATGFIGAYTVRVLLCCNRLFHMDIHIIALLRDRGKADKIFGELLKSQNLEVHLANILDPILLDKAVDYIIHAANETASKAFVDHPVETINSAIYGTGNILEFARKHKIKGILYLSSLEIYGTSGPFLMGERDGGSIDPLVVRNSYPESKRLAECLCASYASEYQVPVKIARLAQIFGCGVAYDDNRVSVQLTRCALEDESIVLHTQGDTIKSFCDIADAVCALFFILLKGQTGEAYNVASEDAISIYDMAVMISKLVAEKNVKVITRQETNQKYGYAPTFKMKLDTSKLRSLGWEAGTQLRTAFHKMLKYMEAVRAESNDL